MSVLLLTGVPGSGKTTALRRAADTLSEQWRLGGFYTEEIREAGVRRGFRVVTFDGQRRDLARADSVGPARVGRYGVDVTVMDTLAGTLRPGRHVDVWLVDEIVKMECTPRRYGPLVFAIVCR